MELKENPLNGLNEINDHVNKLIQQNFSNPDEINIVKHSEVLERLLSEVMEMNFSDYLNIPTGESRQKHIIVGVVKKLLELAESKNWNLCNKYDSIYIYNGAYWQKLERAVLKRFLGDCATKMGCPDYDSRHYEFKDKLWKQFMSDAFLPEPNAENDEILINLKNGTIQFKNGNWNFRPYNPNDFLTYQLPFEYNPKNTCPLFDKYLTKVLPGEGSRSDLQEFSGYIFTKFNFEKMLMLIGGGANGKSVFFSVINALIGKENVLNYSMSSFEKEYNRAKLVGKFLNYSSEKGTDLNFDTFKALVSSEPLQACEKWGNPFTLYNFARFIINSNKLPQHTENTDGFFRRWLIIDFNVTIPEHERDTELAKKIIANELSGVFNWLLVGLERIAKNKKFTISEASEKALLNFKKQSDNVALFIETMTYEPSDNGKETIANLYKEYKEFCKDDGYIQCGKNNFSARFESHGFKKVKIGGTGTLAFLAEKKKVV